MASFKKKRKDAKNAPYRPAKPTAPGAFRHPDGDRRWRGSYTADQGVTDKRARQQFGALIPDDGAAFDDLDDDD